MILHINTDVYRVSVILYISELNNERNRLPVTLIVYFGVDLENELHIRINKYDHIFNKYYYF